MRAFIVSLSLVTLAMPSIVMAHGDTPEHGSVAIVPRADRRAIVTELPAVECLPCTDDGDGSGSVTDDAETPASPLQEMTRPDAE